jgi:short-subunit dehydrogenase
MNSPQQQIWVTGASTGIGQEIALQYAKAGQKVFISARSSSALDEMARQYPQNIVAITADVGDEKSLQQAMVNIASCTTHIDIAILNAGTCEYINDGIIDTALTARVMSTNFQGAVNAAAAVMPMLEKAKTPALYAVSSQVTALPITRSEAYGASKAAMEYFFRTLRIDWQARGIHVGIIRPGFVKTPLTDKNDFDMPGIWPVEKAAAVIIDGITKRKLEISFPFSLSFTLGLLAALPQGLWLRLSKNMTQKNDTTTR